MYALIDISNQMLEDSAFDHAGASLRKAGLAVTINEMLKRRRMLRRGPVAGCKTRVAEECGNRPLQEGTLVVARFPAGDPLWIIGS